MHQGYSWYLQKLPFYPVFLQENDMALRQQTHSQILPVFLQGNDMGTYATHVVRSNKTRPLHHRCNAQQILVNVARKHIFFRHTLSLQHIEDCLLTISFLTPFTTTFGTNQDKSSEHDVTASNSSITCDNIIITCSTLSTSFSFTDKINFVHKQ